MRSYKLNKVDLIYQIILRKSFKEQIKKKKKKFKNKFVYIKSLQWQQGSTVDQFK